MISKGIELFKRGMALPKQLMGVYKGYQAVKGLRSRYTTAPYSLSLREFEDFKYGFQGIKRVGVLGILVTPPIIGGTVAALAFLYPRQLLSLHFWTDAEESSFLEDEFQERLTYAASVKAELEASAIYEAFLIAASTKAACSGYEASTTSRSTTTQKRNTIELDRIPNMTISGVSGVESLSGALGLFTNFGTSVRRAIPQRVLRNSLSKRAHEVILEDYLMRKEGLSSLTDREVQRHCVRRGLPPKGSAAELRGALKCTAHSEASLRAFQHISSQKGWSTSSTKRYGASVGTLSPLSFLYIVAVRPLNG
jgi:hypothetical protein